MFFIIMPILLLFFIISILFFLKVIVNDYKTTNINFLHLTLGAIFILLPSILSNYFFWRLNLFIALVIIALFILLAILTYFEDIKIGKYKLMHEGILWFWTEKDFHNITAPSDILWIFVFFASFYYLSLSLDKLFWIIYWLFLIFTIFFVYYITKRKFNAKNLYYNLITFWVEKLEDYYTYLAAWKYIKRPKDYIEKIDYKKKKEVLSKTFNQMERFAPWFCILWAIIILNSISFIILNLFYFFSLYS